MASPSKPRKDLAELSARMTKRNLKAPGEYSFNALYSSYKTRALKKEISFTLTKEQFRSITSKPCVYCGIEALRTFGSLNAKHNQNGMYLYNGIDRIVNKYGYDIENCVPCCEICNKAKRDLSEGEFINWIVRIGLRFVS